MARVILEAAGRPTELAPIVEAMRAMSAAVVLPFTVVLDRAMLDVTWSPHGMASRRARGRITAASCAQTGKERTMPDVLSALRSSTEHLRRVVEDLDAGQLDAPAYPSEWSVADVLSHLGSGAEILQRRLDDTLAERETPAEFSPAVWAEWDDKASIAKRSDGLFADQELVQRLESLSDEEQRRFRFTMGPISEDFNGFVGLRLNEHALHTWDIEVSLEPTATLSSEASELIVDRLELIARFTGKATDVDPPLSVRTTDPRRDFALSLGPEAVSLRPSGPEVLPDLELPAEAFIRLIYGRLDPEHTPPLEGSEHLVTLRRVFPGP